MCTGALFFEALKVELLFLPRICGNETGVLFVIDAEVLSHCVGVPCFCS